MDNEIRRRIDNLPKKEYGMMEKLEGEDRFHVTSFQFDTIQEAMSEYKKLKNQFPRHTFRILHRPPSPTTYEQLMRGPIHEDVKHIKANRLSQRG